MCAWKDEMLEVQSEQLTIKGVTPGSAEVSVTATEPASHPRQPEGPSRAVRDTERHRHGRRTGLGGAPGGRIPPGATGRMNSPSVSLSITPRSLPP